MAVLVTQGQQSMAQRPYYSISCSLARRNEASFTCLLGPFQRHRTGSQLARDFTPAQIVLGQEGIKILVLAPYIRYMDTGQVVYRPETLLQHEWFKQEGMKVAIPAHYIHIRDTR